MLLLSNDLLIRGPSPEDAAVAFVTAGFDAPTERTIGHENPERDVLKVVLGSKGLLVMRIPERVRGSVLGWVVGGANDLHAVSLEQGAGHPEGKPRILTRLATKTMMMIAMRVRASDTFLSVERSNFERLSFGSVFLADTRPASAHGH